MYPTADTRSNDEIATSDLWPMNFSLVSKLIILTSLVGDLRHIIFALKKAKIYVKSTLRFTNMVPYLLDCKPHLMLLKIGLIHM